MAGRFPPDGVAGGGDPSHGGVGARWLEVSLHFPTNPLRRDQSVEDIVSRASGGGVGPGLVLLADDRERICQPLAMMIRRAGFEARAVPPEGLADALAEGGVMAVLTGLSRWRGGAAEALLLVGRSGQGASVLFVSGTDGPELELAERLGPPLGVAHAEALRLPVHAWEMREFLHRAAGRRRAAAPMPDHGA
jgi:hypothetical protein